MAENRDQGQGKNPQNQKHNTNRDQTDRNPGNMDEETNKNQKDKETER